MLKLYPSIKRITVLLGLLGLLLSIAPPAQATWFNLSRFGWTEINDNAPWAARAGLQVVNHRGKFILMGGRTPLDPAIGGFPGASQIWSDVWQSGNKGRTWHQLLQTEDPNHWPPRAYFQAVKKGGYIYVMGGQNFELIPNPDPNGPPFISQSVFFNDCWRSRNGKHWRQMTDSAKWAGRAGLMAIAFKGKLWVMGGSFNDDPAVIGGPPTRVYFNDVYSSRDGATWECATESAPWTPRAGGALAVKNGYLYLFGGEDGFLGFPPPYYNDVWRTRDGAEWELVQAAAQWPARPGHRVEVVYNKFVLWGGFGQSMDPTDPFKPSNPMDIWTSETGKNWTQISDAPWNAMDPADIKYDFASLVAWGGWRSPGPAIYTFGGDRETFNFADPTQYLNVDNDVWRYGLPRRGWFGWGGSEEAPSLEFSTEASPNPFNPSTNIQFTLPQSGYVDLKVFNVLGQTVTTLVNEDLPAGEHSVSWQGTNQQGERVASGVYFYQISTGDINETRRLILLK